MNREQTVRILEAVLMAANEPLSLDRLVQIFDDNVAAPNKARLREALDLLKQEMAGRSVELVEVGSGYRVQVRQSYAFWVARLWDEKPARYSRAMLETLALIAYRQPVTRADIEEVRGVVVSTNIVKTLMERDWIQVIGHREVPGRPALYATTRAFLDYFNLKSLDQLPSLKELGSLENIHLELPLPESDEEADQAETGANAAQGRDGKRAD